MRAMVDSSNSSLAYSKVALSPSALSQTCSVRSTCAVLRSISSGLSVTDFVHAGFPRTSRRSTDVELGEMMAACHANSQVEW